MMRAAEVIKLLKRPQYWAGALWSALLSSAPAGATQPLDAFLAQAASRSFDARQIAAIARQRELEMDIARSRLIPSLSARGVFSRNEQEVAADFMGQRLLITPRNQVEAVVQLDVPIIDLASYHRYKATEALGKSAAEQQNVTRLDVSRSVARAYYQYLGASALVASAEQSVSVAEANQKNVENRRSAGAATDLDFERAAASIARAEQDLADAQLGVALAARALESLSGLSPDAPAAPLAEDDLRDEGPLPAWMDLASRAPATRVASHLRDAAEQTRKASARSVWPTLSASFQERLTNATGFSGRSSNYALQLILSWRLDYSVLSTEPAQAAALEAQQVELERAQRAAVDAAFEAYERVRAGIVKSRAARTQRRAAERAALLSLDRYEIGAATQLDVTLAQREAFLAAAAQIQADFDLGYARAALRLAAGIPLSTHGAPRAGK